MGWEGERRRGASHRWREPVMYASPCGQATLPSPSPPIARTHAPACGQDAQRDLEACVGGGAARLPVDPSLSPLSPGDVLAAGGYIFCLALTMTHVLPGTFTPAFPPPHW